MQCRTPHLLIVLLAMVAWPACGQDQPPINLPAVLIIGDEVYQQAQDAKKELKDHATVTFANWPMAVLRSSTNAIEQIDLLLGLKDAKGNAIPENKRPIWNLIHVNVGLGDLIHRVPGLKSHRNLPYDFGGVITTTPEQYEKNLNTLIQLLTQKAPKAKIIWANTTPIPASSDNWFRAGSETEYNQIAERVMKKHRIPINDMHTYALGIMKDAKPASTSPFVFGKTPLHPPVVACLLRELTGK